MPLLSVRNLHAGYALRAEVVLPALAGITFELQEGETLGVLGESGSGKSTLAGALLRLLAANAAISNGEILLEGRDLLRVGYHELREIRGRRIALIPQEPSLALHPTIRVIEQVSSVLAAHVSLNRKALREKALHVLSMVFPSDMERIARCYPHELSGGQRQRVLIAQAIACGPSLIVADEPTASLDPTTQQEILTLFAALRRQLNLAMVFITHNPALLAGLADRIMVLYAGRMAEIGPTEQVLTSPQHPYTRALLQCMPSLADAKAKDRRQLLPAIPGEPANLAVLMSGCRFEPRCTDRFDLCTEREPEFAQVAARHGAACFKHSR